MGELLYVHALVSLALGIVVVIVALGGVLAIALAVGEVSAVVVLACDAAVYTMPFYWM